MTASHVFLCNIASSYLFTLQHPAFSHLNSSDFKSSLTSLCIYLHSTSSLPLHFLGHELFFYYHGMMHSAQNTEEQPPHSTGSNTTHAHIGQTKKLALSLNFLSSWTKFAISKCFDSNSGAKYGYGV
jgi:hypothetical protein